MEHTIHPLGDGIGRVTLLASMGGDHAIVNRARKCYQSQDRATPDSDARLLGRLVGSKPLHGTTLRGTVMTFDVIAPLFVVRQWTRHIVGHDADGADIWHTGGGSFDAGAAFDEQSFRYTEGMEFYIPSFDRLHKSDYLQLMWKDAIQIAIENYRMMRKSGLPKELARCFLPSCVYSQFEWTVNLQALFDWYGKRQAGGGAQWEITQYANAVWSLVRDNVAPEACAAWLASKAPSIAALTAPGKTITEAFAELREQFGAAFDAIQDVDAWVKAVRSGDDAAISPTEG